MLSFMDQVTTGETLIALGPANYIAAATAFFKAIKMYPAPVELIMIYQKATPEEVFDIIMRMVGKDVSRTHMRAKTHHGSQSLTSPSTSTHRQAQLGGATDKNQAASSLAALGVMGAVPKQGSANLDEVDDEAAPTAPSSQASSQEWDTLSGASLGPSIGGAAPATSSAAPFDGPSSTADVATTEAALEMQNSSTPASIDPSGVTDATETPAATVISESTPFDFSAGGSYAPSPLFKKASPAASASQEQPKADSKPEVRHADEVSKETGA